MRLTGDASRSVFRLQEAATSNKILKAWALVVVLVLQCVVGVATMEGAVGTACPAPQWAGRLGHFCCDSLFEACWRISTLRLPGREYGRGRKQCYSPGTHMAPGKTAAFDHIVVGCLRTDGRLVMCEGDVWFFDES